MGGCDKIIDLNWLAQAYESMSYFVLLEENMVCFFLAGVTGKLKWVKVTLQRTFFYTTYLYL